MAKQSQNTTTMVIDRFINYGIYSFIISTVYFLICFILNRFDLLNNSGIKDGLFKMNIIFSVGLSGFLIFALMKIISFQRYDIVQKFNKTQGYINLIYTFAFAFTNIYGAIIISSISVLFSGLNYFFIWLLIFCISMNVFSLHRIANVLMIFIKHVRNTNYKITQ